MQRHFAMSLMIRLFFVTEYFAKNFHFLGGKKGGSPVSILASPSLRRAQSLIHSGNEGLEEEEEEEKLWPLFERWRDPIFIFATVPESTEKSNRNATPVFPEKKSTSDPPIPLYFGTTCHTHFFSPLPRSCPAVLLLLLLLLRRPSAAATGMTCRRRTWWRSPPPRGRRRRWKTCPLCSRRRRRRRRRRGRRCRHPVGKDSETGQNSDDGFT